MKNIGFGYLVSVLVLLVVLLGSALSHLPDGNLHMYFCDVGQGDAMYIRFPNGKDMLIDGGPGRRVLDCLGESMPFWDRTIDVVVLSHPQQDHMAGLVDVLDRYDVQYVVRSDVLHTSQTYQKFVAQIEERAIETRYFKRGDRISIGGVSLVALSPSANRIEHVASKGLLASSSSTDDVLGAEIENLNDFSLVLHLRYGQFDALFTGDADVRVEPDYVGDTLPDQTFELLKVPHHGSKTGLSSAFAEWLDPQISIIHVGKNGYGHPSPDIVLLLENGGSDVIRTDEEGTIHVVSDGESWWMDR